MSASAAAPRWKITDGGKSLTMTVAETFIPHYDHMEMSGEQVSTVLRWGVDPQYGFIAERTIVFPMLRTLPNDTHASLSHCFASDPLAAVCVNGFPLSDERVEKVEIDGAFSVCSEFIAKHDRLWEKRVRPRNPRIAVRRTYFASAALPAVCECFEIRNLSDREVTLFIPEYSRVITTDASKGVDGSYVVRCDTDGCGTYRLESGQTAEFAAVYRAYRTSESPSDVDVAAEYAARKAFIAEAVDASLLLETPDSVLNTAFRYAKIRGSESIFRTKGGLMHSPGGERFYAAMWTNDEAEYINPFFPFTGYGKADSASMNTFRHFARYMNDEGRPLPSSIIAEGDDAFSWKGDRGDGTMVAYGAARYALASGRRAVAEELWPLIEWCLEFTRRQSNADGAIASDTDELEERFPSGDANLCTSTLYYDALISAVMLGREIGADRKLLASYERETERMRDVIERYFGARVCGYDTYRYYDGNTLLRSWICMPLIAGIFDRAEQTVDALFGPEMMTDDGILTEQGSATFWDRATLYALRGAYIAGFADRAQPHLENYSVRRLLGDHVPYPVEAYPEGGCSHLSAECGLYCRVFTEGMFGIRPTGLRRFDLTPRMPSKWNVMALRRIKAFDSDFDIEVERIGAGRLRVTVAQRGKRPAVHNIREGASIDVRLD